MTVSPKARVWALAFFAAACGAACADRDDDQTLAPSVLGMTQNVAPIYSDQEVTLYQTQIAVRLPMRRPTDEERGALGQAPPFPRMPFLKAEDVDVTVRFTLVNLDATKRTVELLLDPWNEFVRYRPMIQMISEEQTTPDFSGFDKYFVLEPKERFEGVITPDDTKEMAIDLATAQSLIARPPAIEGGVNGLVNRAFNLQNRSASFDPLLSPIVSGLPAIPGITGFDLGLRTTEPMNVAVEVIIDVKDKNGERIVPVGEEERTFGPPGTILSPPPPERG